MTDHTEETTQAPVAESQTGINPMANQQPGNSPDLNISDLLAVKSIIDIASQRGAFKANELEAVGKTYNRINTFLESVSKKDQ
jgi:hypothetical protein